jgi:lipoprotein-anchoring transpeptidase ErfK/SrfK
MRDEQEKSLSVSGRCTNSDGSGGGDGRRMEGRFAVAARGYRLSVTIRDDLLSARSDIKGGYLRRPASRRPARRRHYLVAVVASLAAFLAAGCSGSTAGPGSRMAAQAPTPSAPRVTISPSNGSPTVPVSAAVVVRSDVPLVSVRVVRGASTTIATPAGTLAGALSADRRTWTSTGGLFAASSYQVVATSATAAGFRGATTARSSFTTAMPALPLKVSWDPVDGETVGIGEPVTLTFSGPVADRAAVQRRLKISSTPAVEGAWSWQSATAVTYRPKQYWPSGTSVHVEANLAGYDAGGGRLGIKDRAMTFTVGATHVSYVDAKTFTMKVYNNGALVKQFPVSLGREQYPTMDGPHNVIAVAPTVVMDSATVGIPKGNPDYYYETVLWDVQLTSGGEYVHAAPWSVGSQGRANVSHGCVNASDADAQWFYQYSRVGDIVSVANTGRPADTSQLGNVWSVPWSTWVAGSALPVTAPAAPASATPTAAAPTATGVAAAGVAGSSLAGRVSLPARAGSTPAATAGTTHRN